MRTQSVIGLLLVLGFCIALPASAMAADYTTVGHGRGRYSQPYCPPQYHPSYPPVRPEAAPDTDDVAPDATDTTPSTEPQLPTQAALSGGPSLGGGAASPMLGRVDAQNRLNLFDTQMAQPVTRVWYTFQYAQDYSTGIEDAVLSGTFANERPNQFHHRFGVELAVTENSSVAVQGEYVATTDGAVFTDFWSNPQLMLKQVVYRDCCSVVSGILGFQFQSSFDEKDTKEDATKVYPGMLMYTDLGCDTFMQGGFQFGLPLEGVQTYHFDWAVSYGKYVYRDPCWGRCGCGSYGGYGNSCCDGCYDGCCGGCCGDCCGGYGSSCGSNGLVRWMRCRCGIPVHAVIAQVELFGKHIVDNAQYELTTDNLSASFTRVALSERRHVVDLTVGGSMLVGDGYGYSSAVSFPLTGGEVRNFEIIVSAWKTF